MFYIKIAGSHDAKGFYDQKHYRSKQSNGTPLEDGYLSRQFAHLLFHIVRLVRHSGPFSRHILGLIRLAMPDDSLN